MRLSSIQTFHGVDNSVSVDFQAWKIGSVIYCSLLHLAGCMTSHRLGAVAVVRAVIHSWTQIREDIRQLDGIECSISEYVEFFEELVSEASTESMPASHNSCDTLVATEIIPSELKVV